jgi:hypothetical protein
MAKVEYANVLLWNVDEVKSESFLEFSFSDISRLLFSTYKLWPTFIGTALTNDRKEVGRLPVLLWSVQESYLAQNRRQSQEIEGVGARGQKRKRREISEDEETETNEGGPVSVKKGKVSYWSDLWSHVRSVFGGFAMSDIPPQPVIEQRSKETSPESSRDLHKEDPGRNRIRIVEKGEEPDVSLIRQMVSSPPPSPLLLSFHSSRQIFEDLMSPTGIRSVWEKKDDPEDSSRMVGYLIGPGDVYGGDYTIYPTHDPSTSHALATVNVLPTPTVCPSLSLLFLVDIMSSLVCFLRSQ